MNLNKFSNKFITTNSSNDLFSESIKTKLVISPEEVWLDYQSIPTSLPPMHSDEIIYPIKYIEKLKLTKVTNYPNTYYSNQFINVIPEYFSNSYTYKIYDSSEILIDKTKYKYIIYPGSGTIVFDVVEPLSFQFIYISCMIYIGKIGLNRNPMYLLEKDFDLLNQNDKFITTSFIEYGASQRYIKLSFSFTNPSSYYYAWGLYVRKSDTCYKIIDVTSDNYVVLETNVANLLLNDVIDLIQYTYAGLIVEDNKLKFVESDYNRNTTRYSPLSNFYAWDDINIIGETNRSINFKDNLGNIIASIKNRLSDLEFYNKYQGIYQKSMSFNQNNIELFRDVYIRGNVSIEGEVFDVPEGTITPLNINNLVQRDELLYKNYLSKTDHKFLFNQDYFDNFNFSTQVEQIYDDGKVIYIYKVSNDRYFLCINMSNPISFQIKEILINREIGGISVRVLFAALNFNVDIFIIQEIFSDYIIIIYNEGANIYYIIYDIYIDTLIKFKTIIPRYTPGDLSQMQIVKLYTNNLLLFYKVNADLKYREISFAEDFPTTITIGEELNLVNNVNNYITYSGFKIYITYTMHSSTDVILNIYDKDFSQTLYTLNVVGDFVSMLEINDNVLYLLYKLNNNLYYTSYDIVERNKVLIDNQLIDSDVFSTTTMHSKLSGFLVYSYIKFTGTNYLLMLNSLNFTSMHGIYIDLGIDEIEVKGIFLNINNAFGEYEQVITLLYNNPSYLSLLEYKLNGIIERDKKVFSKGFEISNNVSKDGGVKYLHNSWTLIEPITFDISDEFIFDQLCIELISGNTRPDGGFLELDILLSNIEDYNVKHYRIEIPIVLDELAPLDYNIYEFGKQFPGSNLPMLIERLMLKKIDDITYCYNVVLKKESTYNPAIEYKILLSINYKIWYINNSIVKSVTIH